MEYPDSPRAAVGVVVLRQGESGATEVLLVKRDKAPSKGMWAVPGGAVELGETLEQAAEREVYEETGVDVRAGHVVHAFDAIERDVARRIAYHYVIVDVVAQYVAGVAAPGDDASAVAWFPVDALDSMPDGEISAETRRLVSRLTRR
jgi:ADP-ribose pyrophosphatase